MSSSRPALLRCLRMLLTMPRQSESHSRHYWKRALWSDPFTDITSMRYVDRQIRDLDRQMRHVFNHLDRYSWFPRLSLKSWGNEEWSTLHRPTLADHVQVAPNGTRKFRVQIDVSEFKPEDVKVNIKERVLTINAKHEEKTADGGKLQQEFSRQYLLPEDTKTSELICSYSDGILNVEAPLPTIEPSQERQIHVEIVDGEKKKI